MKRVWMMALLGALGCLPSDERPPPAELLIEVERSDDARDGFVTEDGWTLDFDRFVTALGGRGLGSETDPWCVDYSLSFYDRLYDFTVADTSKFNLHYGIGDCTLRYRMGTPRPRAILMDGTTADDRDLFRDGLDERVFGDEREGQALEIGVGLLVEGTARKAERQLHFRWLIRQNHAITQCFVSEEVPFRVHLESGDKLVQRAQIRPRELFRDLPDATGRIRFEPFATANDDLDGDGEVTSEERAQADEELTLEELERVKLPAQATLRPLLEGGDFAFLLEQEPVKSGGITLRETMEKLLSARVAWFDGVESCEYLLANQVLQVITSPEGG